MFKGRIRLWEFNKNIRGEDWAALAILHKIRKDSGKRSTEFLVHGKKRTVADLSKHIKSRNMSEDEFLAAALNSAIPDHVRSYTPDPEKNQRSPGQSSSDDASTPSPTKTAFSDAFLLSPTSSRSYLSPSNERSDISHDVPSHDDFSSPSTRITEYSQPEDAQQPDDCPGDDSDYVMVSRGIAKADNEHGVLCDQVQQDVVTMASQMVKPTSIMATYGAEDIQSFQMVNAVPPADSAWQPPKICSKCHQPSSTHFISLDRLAPPETTARNILDGSQNGSLTLPSTMKDYDGATRWVALCFLACIYLTRGEAELSTRSLAEAATVFESMLARRDSLIFTALHLMVTILHMHDQSDIAESVVQSASAVAERLLEPTDSIRLTLQWEVAAAGLGLSESGMHSGMLRKIYADFDTELTIGHPWTIAALYNLAWMLLYEGSYPDKGDDPIALFVEAEDLLQKLYTASCACLSPFHMQSITSLTTLARAQSNLGKDNEAIETYEKAIHDCRYTLGRSHPFRLEAKRRLALMYERLGRKDKTEYLYWEVLRGRVLMLGRHHPNTEAMKLDLIALLKDLGKWEDNGPLQWQIDELFEHTSETSSQHEAF